MCPSFGKFKLKLNETISECNRVEDINLYRVYDFIKMLRYAYNAIFVPTYIIATFEKAGM